jgi:hypothetical protein
MVAACSLKNHKVYAALRCKTAMCCQVRCCMAPCSSMRRQTAVRSHLRGCCKTKYGNAVPMPYRCQNQQLCVEIPQHSSMKLGKDTKDCVSFFPKRSRASLPGCLPLVKRIAMPCLLGFILEPITETETFKFFEATAELTSLQITVYY